MGMWGIFLDKTVHTLCTSTEKGGQKFDLLPGNSLAEVHGNRTHLPPYSEGTPDLKSGGPTSEPGTSAL
jgi:hypothetical protein